MPKVAPLIVITPSYKTNLNMDCNLVLCVLFFNPKALIFLLIVKQSPWSWENLQFTMNCHIVSQESVLIPWDTLTMCHQ